MHLRQSLARYFRNENITEGGFMAREGLVQVIQGSAITVKADVTPEDHDDDELPCTVTLGRAGALVSASCDCEEHNCAHIWATILVAERQGLLLGTVGSGPPYMMNHQASHLAP